LIILKLDASTFRFHNKINNEYVIQKKPIPVAEGFLKIKTIESLSKKILPNKTKDFLSDSFLFKNEPKPIMSKDERTLLIDYYKEDVSKLQNILGCKLPWKNF